MQSWRVAVLWACCHLCQCVGPGYGSAGADFHLDDALNGVFDIALRESWVHHPALDENQLSTTITLRSQTGRQFECRVPQPNVAQTTAEEDDAAPKFDPLQAMSPMERACLSTTDGWWSYEICYGQHVTQFHQSVGTPEREDPSSLGTFVSSSVTGPMSVTQVFESGAICDLTGKPRESLVVYTCQAGSHEQITSISEGSPCSYRIQVVTNLLCPPSESPTQSIECVPLTPTVREASEPQTEPSAVGIAQPGGLAAGDSWSGVYTCQGEQEFFLRVIKPLEAAEDAAAIESSALREFSGVLGFKHTLANGVYRVRIVYDSIARSVTVIPGPWIYRPADFMPLGFKGSIDSVTGLLYGVLPECDDGPWWVSRQSPARDNAPATPTPGADARHGQIARMLRQLDVGPEVGDLDLDDDAWPPAGGVAIADSSDDEPYDDAAGAALNMHDGDAVARIRKMVKDRFGADFQVKLVTSDEAADAGVLDADGGVEDAGDIEDLAGRVSAGGAVSDQTTISTEDMAKIFAKLSDHVVKTAEKKDRASAEAAALHGKRLQMEQIYRGHRDENARSVRERPAE